MTAELLRRKNGYDSGSSSEDESDDVPSGSRSRRQGGLGARAAPSARRRDTDMDIDDDDDPCRAKKRTFFSSGAPGRPTVQNTINSSALSRLLANGNGNGNGNGFKHGIVGIGGIAEWDVSSNGGPSRGVSPASPGLV
jgi:hypothetical protein